MKPPYVLVIGKWRDDVFAGLFFDALPADLRRHVRILEFGHDSLTRALGGAAAVIVMRHGLFSFGHLARCAGWARVPRYYFLDDNLMLLSREPEVYGDSWSAYTDANVRDALRGFDGVLLASRPLMQYFEAHRLHRTLIDYPPIAGPILRRRDTGYRREAGEPFRIAFFGGEHRRDVFADTVYPAVQRLAATDRVELVLAGIDAAALPPAPDHLRVVALSYERRYGAALAGLARHRIDVLVHPTPLSRNNPYKNANVLINARSIGAVPVLSRLPPYDELGSPPPAVLCENDAAAWHAALVRLSREPDLCRDVFAATSSYCDQHFSGASNAGAIEAILARHAPPTRWTRAARRIVASAPLGFDRALVHAKALARRSALVRGAVRRLRHA